MHSYFEDGLGNLEKLRRVIYDDEDTEEEVFGISKYRLLRDHQILSGYNIVATTRTGKLDIAEFSEKTDDDDDNEDDDDDDYDDDDEDDDDDIDDYADDDEDDDDDDDDYDDDDEDDDDDDDDDYDVDDEDDDDDEEEEEEVISTDDISTSEKSASSSINNTTSSNNTPNTLWEGHLVSMAYVDLLSKIKLHHPQTFQGAKFSTTTVDTFAYNFFGEFYTCLTKKRILDIELEDIANFKNVVADLEALNFNIEWLRKRIEKIEDVKFVSPRELNDLKKLTQEKENELAKVMAEVDELKKLSEEKEMHVISILRGDFGEKMESMEDGLLHKK